MASAAARSVWGWALIAARLLEGCGAALTMPLTIANLTSVLPDKQRGWAIGILATGGTIFLAIGPLTGGALVDHASWRWAFAVNIPIVAAAVALSRRWLPEGRGAGHETLDLRGLVLLLAGLAALVTATLEFHDWGRGRPPDGRALRRCRLLAGCVVIVERRIAEPLIQLRLLRIPVVAGSLTGAVRDPILGPGGDHLPDVVHAAGPRIFRRRGAVAVPADRPRDTVAAALDRAASRQAMAPVDSSRAASCALPPRCCGSHCLRASATSCGCCLRLLPSGSHVRSCSLPPAPGQCALPDSARGLASSLVTDSRQIGAVLGVALIGAILSGVELAQRTNSLDDRFDAVERRALDGVLTGGPSGTQLLDRLPHNERDAVREAAASAYASGFSVAMLVVATLLAVTAVVALLTLKSDADPNAPTKHS